MTAPSVGVRSLELAIPPFQELKDNDGIVGRNKAGADKEETGGS
jgi:hypothetical protein